jgi:membrane protease YdiL (CAAX protease family)
MSPASSPDLSPLSLAAGLLVLAYLLIGEPVWGRVAYARLRRDRAADPLALVRLYRLTVLVEWPLAAAVLAMVALDPGIDAAGLGLVWPSGDRTGTVAGMVAAASAGAVIGAVVVRRAAAKGQTVPGTEAVEAKLPRTRRERWWALAVAVTAGVCEELLYRGFLIALFAALGLPVWAAAVAALAVFAVGHVYQGARGVAGVTVLGALFTGAYLLSGSLLPGIWLHVLVDVRGLLFTPPPVGGPPVGGVDYPAGNEASGGR